MGRASATEAEHASTTAARRRKEVEERIAEGRGESAQTEEQEMPQGGQPLCVLCALLPLSCLGPMLYGALDDPRHRRRCNEQRNRLARCLHRAAAEARRWSVQWQGNSGAQGAQIELGLTV